MCKGFSFRKKKQSDEEFFMPFNAIQDENKEKAYFTIVENYIKYYGRRAHRCKMQYYTLSIIKFSAVGLVPVLENINIGIELSWCVSAASAVCLLMEAIIGMMHLRSKWALYRDTYNELLGVQRKYGIHRKCGHCTEAFNEFVSQAEEIIQNEAYKWRETVKKENTDESENNKN